MTDRPAAGHACALLTVVIWGTTFISTKGLLALLIAYPHRLRRTTVRQECTFAAGLCGICLYYLLESIALTYTLAANVGVITSVLILYEPVTLLAALGVALTLAGLAISQGQRKAH